MGSALHVGNLSQAITDRDLSKMFGEYGVVESAVIVRDAATGASKRVASVVMGNEEEAQTAINWLHLSQFEGRTISVTRVRTH